MINLNQTTIMGYEITPWFGLFCISSVVILILIISILVSMSKNEKNESKMIAVAVKQIRESHRISEMNKRDKGMSDNEAYVLNEDVEVTDKVVDSGGTVSMVKKLTKNIDSDVTVPMFGKVEKGNSVSKSTSKLEEVTIPMNEMLEKVDETVPLNMLMETEELMDITVALLNRD